MANFIQNVPAGPYAGDQQEIARKQKLAQMLQQQAMEPIQAPQGGAFAAPISPLHVLAKGLQAYKGKEAATQAQTQQAELGKRQQSERSQALAAALAQGQGSPQPPPEMGGGPAMPPNPMAAAQTLAGSGDPMLQQTGMGMMGQQFKNMVPPAPKPQEPFTLGPGQQRFGPDGKPLASMPFKPETPQGFTLAPGATRYGPDGKPLVQSPVKPSPLVTVDNRQPGDDEYLKERRKQQATRYAELEKGAESAYKRIQTLDRFLEASKKGTAGGVQPVITATQNFLSSFGYSPESLKSVAVMEQAIGDILGTKMQELGARGLTDRDMDILRQALPRVAIAPEAREAVVSILKKSDEFTLNEYSTMRGEEAKNYPDFAKKTPTPAWLRSYQSRKGSGPAPQGIEQQVWDAMEPADRALWTN